MFSYLISYLFLGIAIVGTISSTVFLGLALIGARRHKHDAAALSARLGKSKSLPLSVLKPVHGMEPRLREDLESFFKQDHPDFELLFCARKHDDAALKLAEELSREYPQIKVHIMISGEPPWPNAKVYSLSKMVEDAKHDILVISDSDVAVAPDYLRKVTLPFQDGNVGMTTCVYRGLPVGGLWSRMEALAMSVEMTSGVVIAKMLEGMQFALGPTMVIRKDVLATIGGMAGLGEYCADDFVMGNRTAAAGFEVVLSGHVIDHVVLNRSWKDSWAHQVRWMKSTRFSRPKGHFGTGLTFAMPFGLLGLAAGLCSGHPELGIGLLFWAYLNRVIQCIAIGSGVVNDPRAVTFVWLYPLRDLLGFCFWMASYTGRVIDWRGERYRLEDGGRMVKAK